MAEVWAPVLGLEAFYEVSDMGQVRSLDRLIRNRRGHRLLKGRILRQRKHPFGYPMVTMSAKNKVYHRTVHSLVAEAFLGPRPDGYHTCHRNGKVWDCSVDNLRYDTPGGNSQDRLDHGTFPHGEEIYSAQLKEHQIIEIRERRAAGEPLKDLAKAFGQSEVNICRIVTGDKWARVGGPLTRRNRKMVRLSDDQKAEVIRRKDAGKPQQS